LRHTAFILRQAIGVFEAEMKDDRIGASFGFRDGELRDEGRFVFDFNFEQIAFNDAAREVEDFEKLAGGEAMLGVVGVPGLEATE
jgi:hypothetical protein